MDTVNVDSNETEDFTASVEKDDAADAVTYCPK